MFYMMHKNGYREYLRNKKESHKQIGINNNLMENSIK